MVRKIMGAVALFSATTAFGADIAPEFRFWDTFENHVFLRSRIEALPELLDESFESEAQHPFPNDMQISYPAQASVRNDYHGDLLFDIGLKSAASDYAATAIAVMHSQLTLDVVMPDGYSLAVFNFYQPQDYRMSSGSDYGAANLLSKTSVFMWGDDGDFSAEDTQGFFVHGAGQKSGSNDIDFTARVTGVAHIRINQQIEGLVAANGSTSEAEIWTNYMLFRVTYFRNAEDTSGYSVVYDGTGATAEEGYTPPSWTTGLTPTTVVPEPATWLTSAFGIALLAGLRMRRSA